MVIIFSKTLEKKKGVNDVRFKNIARQLVSTDSAYLYSVNKSDRPQSCRLMVLLVSNFIFSLVFKFSEHHRED